GYLNIYNNYFKAPWMPDRTEANPNELNQDDARYGFRCCHLKNIWTLRLSPLRRGLAIDSTVDIFTFYVPHRHVYGEQWIKFMKDGVNATPLPTVNTTGYIDHAAFLGTINPDTNKIP